MNNRKSGLAMTLIIVGLAVLAPTAEATLLTAGNTVVGADGTANALGTFVVSNTSNYSFAGISGNLVSTVYQISPGTLQIWYQLTESQGSTGGNISAFKINGYAGVASVDVLFRTNLGAGIQAFQNEFLIGNQFGGNFGPGSGANQLQPGETSYWAMVTVAATGYSLQSATVIENADFSGSAQAYAPTSGVPEPATLSLIGCALIGLAFWKRSA